MITYILLGIAISYYPSFNFFSLKGQLILLTVAIFNGIMGILGVILYSLNIPVLGWKFISIEEAVTCPHTYNTSQCNQVVPEYKTYLYTLIWCSNVRFIAWYMEYINTLLFNQIIDKKKCF